MSNHRTGSAFENKRGLFVEVRNNNIDGAIRTLNKKVKEAGLLRELRARQAYEKPSTAKSRRKAEARSRHLKALSQREP